MKTFSIRSSCVIGFAATFCLAIPPGQTEYAVQGGLIRMWIPEGVTNVRGIMAVSGHQGGTHVYNDYSKRGWDQDKITTDPGYPRLGYLEYLQEMSFAAMVFSNDARSWSDIESALQDFAQQTGHPEIEFAPLTFTGLSAGAHYAQDLAASVSDRCIANVPIAYCSVSGKVPSVPVCYEAHRAISNNCTLEESVSSAESLNKQGGFACAIALSVAHHEIGGQSFNIFWLKEIAKLRLPKSTQPYSSVPQLATLDRTQGWLGTVTANSGNLTLENPQISSYSEFSGDMDKAYWFPNKVTAEAWVKFCQHNTLKDFTGTSAIVRPPAKEQIAQRQSGLSILPAHSFGTTHIHDLRGNAVSKPSASTLPVGCYIIFGKKAEKSNMPSFIVFYQRVESGKEPRL